MNVDVRWIAFSLAAILVTANAIWFATGSRRNVGLALYRNVGLPALARNLPVVSPVLTVVTWTLVAMGAPGALRLQLPPVEGDLGRELSLGAFGYALTAVALTIILAYRPPAGLHPRWLVALGYARPSPTLADRLILVFLAIPGLALGLAILAFACLSLLGAV